MIKLDFKKTNGLIPAIVQDADTGDVLMMAYMNPEAWEATQSTRKATFWSRSRQELWVKGLTSGNVQHVKEIYIDCDNDTVLLKVKQMGGAACHTGYKSCFFRRVEGESLQIVGKPVFDPKEVYKR
ncbi:MAG: phosphoribosyl-AMP cyclohydrolase [Desulfobacterales bacterium]|nr:phosphoribosyl-AMP cyclohydrolase [Desulfobacterales bacterium]MDX2510421.1 phosphoribosyl-AMP cyclohydrolase [Desulfobacterales bacterium]